MTKLDRHIYCPICGTALPTQKRWGKPEPRGDETRAVLLFALSTGRLVELARRALRSPGQPVTLEPEAPQSEQRDSTN